MALLQRSQVGVREFGETVTVPNDPKAKLMYYLSCVCTVRFEILPPFRFLCYLDQMSFHQCIFIFTVVEIRLVANIWYHDGTSLCTLHRTQ